MMIPTGFWSYTTSDETNARGKLSQLRALLAAELQQHVGRYPTVNIFQDVVAIPPGEEWEAQIRKAIGESSFIIPIITPGFLQSEWCCREVTLFREREAKLGVRNLVFPLHYVNVDHIDGEDARHCQDNNVLVFLRTRQWTDFRHLRLRNQEGEDVATMLAGLAQGIMKALRDAAAEQARVELQQRYEKDGAARQLKEQRSAKKVLATDEGNNTDRSDRRQYLSSENGVEVLSRKEVDREHNFKDIPSLVEPRIHLETDTPSLQTSRRKFLSF